MAKKVNTPFKRFSEYRMWKQIIDWKETEVRLATFFTVIVLMFLLLIDCFDKLELFRDGLQNIAIYVASAFIGVLGFILAGVAMITSLLNSEVCKRISISCGKDSLKKILCSFEFIAFNVAVLIVVLFCVYLSFFSDLKLFNSCYFYFFSALLIYFVLFVVFYLFALIGNCIQIFYIANMYHDIIKTEEKQFNEVLNEIRLDFILTKLVESNVVNSDTFIDELTIFINNHQIRNKENIIEYFNEHYGYKKDSK